MKAWNDSVIYKISSDCVGRHRPLLLFHGYRPSPTHARTGGSLTYINMLSFCYVIIMQRSDPFLLPYHLSVVCCLLSVVRCPCLFRPLLRVLLLAAVIENLFVNYSSIIVLCGRFPSQSRADPYSDTHYNR